MIEGYNDHNFDLVQRDLNDHPQVIKDLRMFINGSTVQNKKFLENRIIRFNESVERFYNTHKSTPFVLSDPKDGTE